MAFVNCNKLFLVVLCVQSVLLISAIPGRKKQPKDKGEAMYNCLKHQSCGCGKGPDLQECFDNMEEATKGYFVEQVKNCFELDYTIASSEAADVACKLPEEGWVRCRNEILDNFNQYLNEMYMSDDPEKKNEIPGVENAKVCFGPHISACQAFPNQCI